MVPIPKADVDEILALTIMTYFRMAVKGLANWITRVNNSWSLYA